ncbi:MAG TPA: hypothetical protein VK116_09275, partial [Planctomycetota bacterium]|nr:hypothetical protein [Planctomycetota bacterium]
MPATYDDPFELDGGRGEIAPRADVMSGELISTNRFVAKLNVNDERIAELRKQYAGLRILDDDEDSYKAVSAAISHLSGLRTLLNERRLEIKRPVLADLKVLDEEAKRLTAALQEIEDPLVAERKRVLDARKAEKEAREAAERKRVEHHRACIAEMQEWGASVSTSVGELADLIAELESIEITAETFEEFATEALLARSTALERLRKRLGEVRAAEEERARREAEEARLKAEREELERRERELREREERIKAEEEARERERLVREAEERAREEERQRAIEANKRREEAERKAAEERKAEEERQRREAEERAEAE